MTTSISSFIQSKFAEIQTRVPVNMFISESAALSNTSADASASLGAAGSAAQSADGQNQATPVADASTAAGDRKSSDGAAAQTFAQALSFGEAAARAASESDAATSSGALASGARATTAAGSDAASGTGAAAQAASALAAQAEAAASPGATATAVAAAMRASLVFPALIVAPAPESEKDNGEGSGENAYAGGSGDGGLYGDVSSDGGGALYGGVSGANASSGLGDVYGVDVGYNAQGVYDNGTEIVDPGWDDAGYDSSYLDGYEAGMAAAALTANERAELSANTASQNSYGDPEIQDLITNSIYKASVAYGVDSNLIKAVIMAESAYSPTSLSPVGAQGLMQLMPSTSEYLGIENPWDIEQNIEGGSRLLRKYLGEYNGDISLALAAYNAGPGAVSEYGGVPPYAETQNYVSKVMAYYDQYAAGLV